MAHVRVILGETHETHDGSLMSLIYLPSAIVLISSMWVNLKLRGIECKSNMYGHVKVEHFLFLLFLGEVPKIKHQEQFDLG